MTLPQKNSDVPTWRKIQRENFTRLDPLADFLQLSQSQRSLLISDPRFSLNLPRRLAEKMAKKTLDDPIFRQFVPLQEEKAQVSGFVPEPLQDQTFRKTKKLLKKYTGRALLLASSACAMHCRFCFRQNFPYETTIKDFEEEISYLKNDPTISEIILSGGDPLSLSDSVLKSLFTAFEEIPHLRRIRFHTRFPIGIPERIDASFLNLLASSSKQIFFIVHCSHPKEFDSDVQAALKKIQRLGIPVLNQCTLLKQVNDNETTLLELCETLANAGVLFYYLHLHDLVEGTAHFDVALDHATSLIRFVRENLSGYAVPQLVREVPGKKSKTFINT